MSATDFVDKTAATAIPRLEVQIRKTLKGLQIVKPQLASPQKWSQTGAIGVYFWADQAGLHRSLR